MTDPRLIFLEDRPRLSLTSWLGKHLDCDVVVSDYDADTDEANIVCYVNDLSNRDALQQYHLEHPELLYVSHISSKAVNFIG